MAPGVASSGSTDIPPVQSTICAPAATASWIFAAVSSAWSLLYAL